MVSSRLPSALAHVISLVAFAAPALAVACSSTQGSGIETTPSPRDDAGTADAALDAPSSPDVDPQKKDASAPDAPTGECSSETTQTSCVACCSGKHEDGAAAYFIAVIDCMCLQANCAKSCEKTLCEPNNPKKADAECEACLTAKNSACAPSIKTTCTGDPNCLAFDACVGDSSCPSKSN